MKAREQTELEQQLIAVLRTLLNRDAEREEYLEVALQELRDLVKNDATLEAHTALDSVECALGLASLELPVHLQHLKPKAIK